MSSPFPQPVRNSLVSQAVNAIRERIAAGLWEDKLPGERYFCDLLQVSRPTVRSALKILEDEGLFTVSQGAHRILVKGAKQAKAPAARPIVRVLNRQTFMEMHPSSLYLINEMHQSLERAGYGLSVESPHWLKYQDPTPYLADYVRKNPAACWALFTMPATVQRWFSKSGLPAIVSGSCYEDVTLPSIDFDYRAITHHAVGRFIKQGYHKIILFIPEQSRPGNATTVAAFNEEINKVRPFPLKGLVIYTPEETATLDRILQNLISSPTERAGLFITDALKTLHIVSFLTRNGFNPGGREAQFGVIARDEDFYLEHLVPSPSRYRLHKKTFATRFCRMLVQLARTRALPSKPALIIPEFHDGETI